MHASPRPARRWAPWLAAGATQVALVVATAFPPFSPGLGDPVWHHHVSLLLALGFTAACWTRLTRDRAFLSTGVLVTTSLAVASAFLILYFKADLKAADRVDWAKWWHVAWSWFALAFFAGHTWANRSGLARSFRRLTRRWPGRSSLYGGLAAIALAVPLTWSAWGAATLQEPTYILATHLTWLALLAPVYAVWLAARWRARQGRPFAWAGRAPVQGALDTWLVPFTLLANVSGFPLLYLGTKDTALKYVAKYWHTWPSIAMAILVFAHTVQFWPAVRHHLQERRQRRDGPG